MTAVSGRAGKAAHAASAAASTSRRGWRPPMAEQAAQGLRQQDAHDKGGNALLNAPRAFATIAPSNVFYAFHV